VQEKNPAPVYWSRIFLFCRVGRGRLPVVGYDVVGGDGSTYGLYCGWGGGVSTQRLYGPRCGWLPGTLVGSYPAGQAISALFF